MKKTFCITVLLFFSSFAFSEHVRYFKTYRTDPRDCSIITGQELSAEDAKNERCNKFTYDNTNTLIQIEGFAQGLLFKDTLNGVYKTTIHYSDNSFTEYFFDRIGKPALNKEGVYGVEIEKNTHGYSYYFLDQTGSKVTNNYGVFVIENRVEQNHILQTFYNENKNITKNSMWVFGKEITTNNNGHIVEVRYLDENRSLMNNKNNFAVEIRTLDKKDNLMKAMYLDEHRQPAFSYPFGTSLQVKTNGAWTHYDSQHIEIDIKPSHYLDGTEPDPVHYDLVMPLDSRELKLNFFSINSYYSKLSNIKKQDDLYHNQYYISWSNRIYELKNDKQLSTDSTRLTTFHSQTPNNARLSRLIADMDDKEFEDFFRSLLTGAMTQSYSDTGSPLELLMNSLDLEKEQPWLTHIADPIARFCYGHTKIKGLNFFKWNNILFCTSPYCEETGGSGLKHLEKSTIDFSKIPLTEDIQYVIFEGVTVEQFNPRKYYSDTQFIFNNCNIKSGYEGKRVFMNTPSEVINDELILYKNSRFLFLKCVFENLELYLYSGNSNYPEREYQSYTFRFVHSDIQQCTIDSNKFEMETTLHKPFEHNIEFMHSNIEKLELIGYYTSLNFNNTKVKEFYGADITNIETQLTFKDSSFESPLNIPNLTLKDSAIFSLINTSFHGYIKLPWEAVKGKIKLDLERDFIKTYGNLYNLLSNNYKSFALLKEADESYFYWKEFERDHFWEFYWSEPDHHWYNPLDVAVAIGYMAFNNVNYYSCGYGIKPLWIFPFTLCIVTFFALIFFFIPKRISNIEEHLVSRNVIVKKLRKMDLDDIKTLFEHDDFDFSLHKQSLIEDILSSISSEELLEKLNLKPSSKYNFLFFWNCFYFSFSTFTTIGIGDWYPSGKLNKAIVMIEGALGWLCLGLFITTYANILLR